VLAGFAHPHQHAAAPMQIHSDDLPSLVCWLFDLGRAT
jgi:hypothetical protein